MNSLFVATKVKLLEWAIDILFEKILRNFKKLDIIKLKIGDVFDEIIPAGNSYAYIDCIITDILHYERIAMIEYIIRAQFTSGSKTSAYYYASDLGNGDIHVNNAIINIETSTFNKSRTILNIHEAGIQQRIGESFSENDFLEDS